MSDAPFAPAPARPSSARSNLLIGGIAFVGGVGLTVAALQWHGGNEAKPSAPAPAPSTAVTTEALQPSVPSLPPGTDMATLNAREAELAGRLDQLELRLHDVDSSARVASSYATRAERLMIAFAVRRAIERGSPLGTLETQLRQRFEPDNPQAVGAVLRAAAEPVTLEDLRAALDTISNRLLAAPDETAWGHVRRLLGDLVVLRDADAPSPRAMDRLRRARRALNEGRVEAALAEVSHMPGADSAKSWIGAARRYIDARRGLTAIEQAAATLPAVRLPAPQPAPAPAQPETTEAGSPANT